MTHLQTIEQIPWKKRKTNSPSRAWARFWASFSTKNHGTDPVTYTHSVHSKFVSGWWVFSVHSVHSDGSPGFLTADAVIYFVGIQQTGIAAPKHLP